MENRESQALGRNSVSFTAFPNLWSIRFMKKLILSIFFLSLLSACIPPMTREQQLSIYRSRCLDYGYQRGTLEFAHCMKEQEAQEVFFAIQTKKVHALEEKNRLKEKKIKDKETMIHFKK